MKKNILILLDVFSVAASFGLHHNKASDDAATGAPSGCQNVEGGAS